MSSQAKSPVFTGINPMLYIQPNELKQWAPFPSFVELAADPDTTEKFTAAVKGIRAVMKNEGFLIKILWPTIWGYKGNGINNDDASRELVWDTTRFLEMVKNALQQGADNERIRNKIQSFTMSAHGTTEDSTPGTFAFDAATGNLALSMAFRTTTDARSGLSLRVWEGDKLVDFIKKLGEAPKPAAAAAAPSTAAKPGQTQSQPAAAASSAKPSTGAQDYTQSLEIGIIREDYEGLAALVKRINLGEITANADMVTNAKNALNSWGVKLDDSKGDGGAAELKGAELARQLGNWKKDLEKAEKDYETHKKAHDRLTKEGKKGEASTAKSQMDQSAKLIQKLKGNIQHAEKK